jgi:multisubunit Na+/H+ antiporter MnhC subunit
MNTYFRSLYYGLCLALFFVGLFGLAIDSSMWNVSVGLMITSSIFAFLIYKVGKEYE